MKPESNNGYLRSMINVEEREFLPPAARELARSRVQHQVSIGRLGEPRLDENLIKIKKEKNKKSKMKPESNNGYLRSAVIGEESELLPPGAHEISHAGTPLQV